MIHALAIAVATLLGMEVTARAYWWFNGVPFGSHQDLRHVFYPNVQLLRAENNLPEPTRRDILVLGGSVIDEGRPALAALDERLGPGVRLHVGARVAHTSLDSRRKSLWLSDLPYDEILIYHGINDCKYDNMPEELFDDEYSAYPFYKAFSALAQHPEIDRVLLPYTLHFLWIQVTSARLRPWRKPTIAAEKHWVKHGADIKSAATFRENLETIVHDARQRAQTVHLATFAYYIPEDYSYERFEKGELDYRRPYLPVEIWGSAENVSACIEVHNGILRDIANANSNVRLVDVEAAIPRTGLMFRDPCHFTREGEMRFTDVLFDALNEQTAEPGSASLRRSSRTPTHRRR